MTHEDMYTELARQDAEWAELERRAAGCELDIQIDPELDAFIDTQLTRLAPPRPTRAPIHGVRA